MFNVTLSTNLELSDMSNERGEGANERGEGARNSKTLSERAGGSIQYC